MGYQVNREKRIAIFEDTMQICEREGRLLAAIQDSRAKTKIYKEPLLEITKLEQHYEVPCKVTVSKHRTLEAAQLLSAAYPQSRIGLLNFASATNPGGGVVRGSNAQEECLCRCTTLYPCLDVEHLWQEYYTFHRRRHNALYTNACIYTPGIIGIKADRQWPELMPEKDWFLVDVISCPAPNLREKSSNSMNPSAGEKVSIEDRELQELLEKRITGILQVAAGNGIDVLVLGAFGCGAFCNSPNMVAAAFKKALKDFEYSFKAVEFAVYCPPQDETNYQVFSSVFK